MSFWIEFHAETPEEAYKLITEYDAPSCVKDFLRQGVSAINSGPIYIKASGHLCSVRDRQNSNAELIVRQVVFMKPK